ncbi:MAG: hypothetical protein QOI81_1096 [Actinomycetota bacterium]|nr:hypothetical protein [Actinomycetota bacterium]
MKDLLRTATLVPLPGLIPLGLALLSWTFRPVPVLVPSARRSIGDAPGTGRRHNP